jgi:hypothetical protein
MTWPLARSAQARQVWTFDGKSPATTTARSPDLASTFRAAIARP